MTLAVISIVTLLPVMADSNDNKISICHYVKEDRIYKELTIGGTAIHAHEQYHEKDIVPAPESGCPPQDDSEIESQDNLYEIISRTHSTKVLPGERLNTEYYCESGEIIIGGQIEMPTMENPISNDGNIISGTEQSYTVVTGKNTTLEPIKVVVTYLCYTSR